MDVKACSMFDNILISG